jgi:hypothetical protein
VHTTYAQTHKKQKPKSTKTGKHIYTQTQTWKTINTQTYRLAFKDYTLECTHTYTYTHTDFLPCQHINQRSKTTHTYIYTRTHTHAYRQISVQRPHTRTYTHVRIHTCLPVSCRGADGRAQRETFHNSGSKTPRFRRPSHSNGRQHPGL